MYYVYSLESPLQVIENQRDSYYASWPGAIINPNWLELSLSRTNFNGPKGVRAAEVRLYLGVTTVFYFGCQPLCGFGAQLF